MLRSHYIKDITPSMNGKKIKVAGWVHEVRDIGKIIFMQLRDNSGILQITAKSGVVDEKLMKAMNLPKESVVMVEGEVKANKESKKGFEIIPTSLTNLNPLSAAIPFEITGKVPAEIDVRLNHRSIDLRRRETSAIFKVESTIMSTFRNFFYKKGFQEIRTPGIVAEATEGGADLFPVQYFEKQAYLAQSPQLYKQLAVIGGMDKIFMIVPVYRAEKSNTVYHLCESTQMDIEMGFADHNDAIKMLKKVPVEIIKQVKKHNAEELELLDAKLDVPKPKVVTYKQALKKLNANGFDLDFGSDFSREHENAICEMFSELTVVKEYPTMVRAFYSMPNEKDPEVCNAFDLLYKGLEISSGAQRVHVPELIIDALKKRDLNPEGFKFYIDAFRNGAPPHAGWSIGLERLSMKLTNRQNIRECALFPRDRMRLTP